MPSATLIFNPHAGAANFTKSIEKVGEFWQQHGWDVEMVPTQYAGHATEIAKEAVSSKRTMVIAAGGDGTLGQISGALAGSDTILAPLPVGTSNVFAREIKLPRPSRLKQGKLLESADSLLHGTVQKMDIGIGKTASATHSFFLWAGVGADGYAIDKIEPRSPQLKSFGPAGYALKGMVYAPNFVPMKNTTVTVDGKAVSGQYVLVLVSNTRLYAGGYVELSPEAKLDDGLMEVWLFAGKQRRDVFKHLFSMVRKQHLLSDRATLLQGNHIKVETEPIGPIHMDAEPAGSTPLEIGVKSADLNILVPTSAPKKLFSQKGIPLQAFS